MKPFDLVVLVLDLDNNKTAWMRIIMRDFREELGRGSLIGRQGESTREGPKPI